MNLFFSRDPGAALVVKKFFELTHGEKVFWAKDYSRSVLEKANISFEDFNSILDGSTEISDLETVTRWIEEIKPDVVFTGTTNVDDFTDRLIWKACQNLGIKTVAILDQPMAIAERFHDLAGKLYPPSYVICPTQAVAEQITGQSIALKDAVVMPNPYLSSLALDVESFIKRRNECRDKLAAHFDCKFETLSVFVSEPERFFQHMDPTYAERVQDEIETFALAKKGLISSRYGQSLLVVKLHPKENIDSYNDVHPHVIKDEFSNYELMAAADIVIGIKSTFLVEAVIFGRYVVSIDLLNHRDLQLFTNKLELSHRVTNFGELIFVLNNFNSSQPTDLASIHKNLGLDSNIKKRWDDFIQSL